jgi:hypothetical protein
MPTPPADGKRFVEKPREFLRQQKLAANADRGNYTMRCLLPSAIVVSTSSTKSCAKTVYQPTCIATSLNRHQHVMATSISPQHLSSCHLLFNHQLPSQLHHDLLPQFWFFGLSAHLSLNSTSSDTESYLLGTSSLLRQQPECTVQTSSQQWLP